uniref:Uncharacterized protein n=1 Tax=Strigamia maritima TaxID=126957 RepID=T1IKT4_STRMM
MSDVFFNKEKIKDQRRTPKQWLSMPSNFRLTMKRQEVQNVNFNHTVTINTASVLSTNAHVIADADGKKSSTTLSATMSNRTSVTASSASTKPSAPMTNRASVIASSASTKPSTASMSRTSATASSASTKPSAASMSCTSVTASTASNESSATIMSRTSVTNSTASNEPSAASMSCTSVTALTSTTKSSDMMEITTFDGNIEVFFRQGRCPNITHRLFRPNRGQIVAHRPYRVMDLADGLSFVLEDICCCEHKRPNTSIAQWKLVKTPKIAYVRFLKIRRETSFFMPHMIARCRPVVRDVPSSIGPRDMVE